MAKSEIGQQVGKRVREVRRQTGLTQPELGERAHMAAAEISKIENGRRTPTLETLERLSKAMGVSVIALVSVDPGRDLRTDTLERILSRLQTQPPEVLTRILAVINAMLEGA